jgi:hypothetical protein
MITRWKKRVFSPVAKLLHTVLEPLHTKTAVILNDHLFLATEAAIDRKKAEMVLHADHHGISHNNCGKINAWAPPFTVPNSHGLNKAMWRTAISRIRYLYRNNPSTIV